MDRVICLLFGLTTRPNRSSRPNGAKHSNSPCIRRTPTAVAVGGNDARAHWLSADRPTPRDHKQTPVEIDPTRGKRENPAEFYWLDCQDGDRAGTRGEVV